MDSLNNKGGVGEGEGEETDFVKEMRQEEKGVKKREKKKNREMKKRKKKRKKKRRRTTRERKRGTIKTQKRNLEKSSFSFEKLLSQPSQYPNKEIPPTQQHEHPPR